MELLLRVLFQTPIPEWVRGEEAEQQEVEFVGPICSNIASHSQTGEGHTSFPSAIMGRGNCALHLVPSTWTGIARCHLRVLLARHPQRLSEEARSLTLSQFLLVGVREESELEGRIKHVISLESLCCHPRPKHSFL